MLMIYIQARSAGAAEYNRLHLCTGIRLDTKESDGEAPVMLELWRMLNTSLSYHI